MKLITTLHNGRLRNLSFSSYCHCRRFASTIDPTAEMESSTGSSSKQKKKFSDTVLLPKTKFPIKIPYEKRNDHEVSLATKLQFEQLYGLQRLWRAEQPEFILHDGPPYANGLPHVGHAVNKILKDITNRYKLLRGYRVNYTPGWDCHGLPVELKATKDTLSQKSSPTEPLHIRNAARLVSEKAIASQMAAFRRWGVMAEWNNVYKTTDKSYVKSQLQIFYKLYEKGLVYRDLKPVYWSPSSRTALAEAELEYSERHESPSVYVALDVNTNLKDFLRQNASQLQPFATSDLSLGKDDSEMKAVIWTTTPWTLPSNEAIAFNESENYSLVFNPKGYSNSVYIVASSLVPPFLVVKPDMRVLLQFPGSLLKKLTYKHPWFLNEKPNCPFLPADYVTMDKGTGLVHTAPVHGHDDYLLGLKHKLPMNCFVDDDGHFTSEMKSLKGLSVLTAGNAAVIKQLGNRVLRNEKLIHSYPYDWRTKKPVIVKASLQWFIDTNKLKDKAQEELEKISIYPSNVRNRMLSQVLQRPYWCISRQRSWGVPIPVLYNKKTGKPLVDKTVVNRLCDLVELAGNIDGWWDVPISTLLQNDSVASDYVKGNDIFDIWLDSGISWYTLGEDKIADLYLEGVDQFTGWFQSSLLTSIALRGHAPYKQLFVHGFVVDEEGGKMSKSLGNVVDPHIIVAGKKKDGDSPAYGADVLRWWTATQGSVDGSNIPVNVSLLRSSDESIQKLRNVLRFLVGFCNQESVEELKIDDVSYDELMYVDQWMLSELNQFQKEVTEMYDKYNYHRVLMKTLYFGTTNVSSQYFTWIKDRLYCDSKESQSRKSCIYVLNQLYLTLAKTLAPVLPFLIEETHSHYSNKKVESIYKSTWFPVGEEKQWDNSSVTELFELVMSVRKTLYHTLGSTNSKEIWVELQCNKTNMKSLEILHPVHGDIMDKCDSELTDIFQVSGIDLKCYENNEIEETSTTNSNDIITPEVKFSIKPYGVGHSVDGFSVGISKTEMMMCTRCRRYCCEEGTVLCPRCQSVVKRLSVKEQTPQQQQEQQTHVEIEEPTRKKVTSST